MLTFGKGNAKLNTTIYTFALPAGYTCPGASDCLTWANKNTGKIKDGKDQKFRCFSASQEACFPSARKARWKNFEQLQEALKEGVAKTADLIEKSLPAKAQTVRIHVSGDFFSQDYFDAWLEVSKRNPTKKFYGYTKSLHFWEKRHQEIPENFRLTASYGSKWDEKIDENEFHSSVVISHPDEAKGLAIDHDDSNAYKDGRPKQFALLLHGVQPKDTPAAKAIARLKKEQVEFSYSKTKHQA